MNSIPNAFTQEDCLFIILLVLTSLSGCSPDHGKDLTGTWEMTAYRINQISEDEGIELIWTFADNGEFHQVIRYPDQEVSETARWSISGDSLIIINYVEKKKQVEWKVVRLDKLILEVEHFTPGFFVERGFINKNNALLPLNKK